MKSIVTDPKATSTGIFSVRAIEHKEPGGYDKEEKRRRKRSTCSKTSEYTCTCSS